MRPASTCIHSDTIRRMNHPAGSFCFAELHTGDPEQMVEFYGALFGWTARQLSDTYWMFAAGSTDVVGMRRSGLHRWIACLRVDDIETILSRAGDAGLATIEASRASPGSSRTSSSTSCRYSPTPSWR